jgi:hypothetical protein
MRCTLRIIQKRPQYKARTTPKFRHQSSGRLSPSAPPPPGTQSLSSSTPQPPHPLRPLNPGFFFQGFLLQPNTYPASSRNPDAKPHELPESQADSVKLQCRTAVAQQALALH